MSIWTNVKRQAARLAFLAIHCQVSVRDLAALHCLKS